MEKKPKDTLTLGQIQKILDTPQHTLIHLCEKGVITPDISDTEGRGKSRLFSLENLMEFAIVLHIRKFKIPVLTAKAIIIVLKKIENRVKKQVPGFSMLNVGKKDHMDLTVYVEETENIIFSFYLPSQKSHTIIQCIVPSLSEIIAQKRKFRFETLEKLPEDYSARLEINVSKIFEKISAKLLQ